MHRRSFLIHVNRALATAVAALVAIPGVQYVWNSLRANGSGGATRRRLVRWKDLRPGEPAQFPIVGERRDAWHVQPRETIGRVWLVRRADHDEPDAGSVIAFTSLCPHMGCQVQRAGQEQAFVCPCHRAKFGLDGRPEHQPGEQNHAPRGLDELTCDLAQDEAGEWWVEVQYQRFETGLTHKVARV